MLLHNGWCMRSCLILSVALLCLSGCVTETSSVTRNNPSAKNTVSSQDAAKTRIALAMQYLNAGNTTQAKFNLEKAASFAPHLTEVHYALAYYYEKVGEQQWAKKAYLKALALNPDDPNALNNYGTFLCRIEDYDGARAQLLKAINIPSYLRVAQSYENLALCAVKQDKFDLALEYLENAVQHNGRSQSALIGLAALFYAKSDLHQAENILEAYRNRGFMSARALLLEHLLHQRMGHLERAESLSTTLIQNYPNSRQAALLLREKVLESEFEKLTEQYRQAQIKKITKTGSGRVINEPKIKVTRKKVAKQTASVVKQAADVSQASISLRQNTEKYTGSSPTITPVASTVKSTQLPVKAHVNEDSIRVISFGESTETSDTGQGTVKFYKPDPSKVIFKKSAAHSTDIIAEESRRDHSVNMTVPLLNSEVVMPNVPFHIMKVAENLFSLSVRYDIKIAKLLTWNGLKASDKVKAGSKIFLNNPHITYAIQSDDTLYNIATQHGLQIDDLMRWNKLTPDVILSEGHSLLIVDPNSYIL